MHLPSAQYAECHAENNRQDDCAEVGRLFLVVDHIHYALVADLEASFREPVVAAADWDFC
jgi:hypothetical protein